jgi:AcrR family transcriptional regulator
MGTRRYEQRARAATAEETRERILEATYQRLREAPAEAVSLDRVARMAGVARSTVYLIFGSRAGLFDALGQWLLDRTGVGRLVEAVAQPDVRDHLRSARAASTEMYAAERDVYRALFSMTHLDPDAVAGATRKIEGGREGGLRYLAQRLRDQGILRVDVTVEEATHILWVIASFDAFDLLFTGRGLSPPDVIPHLVTMAERALCQQA